MSGKITDSANVASEIVISTPPMPQRALFEYLAALAAKYSNKTNVKKLWKKSFVPFIQVLANRGPFTIFLHGCLQCRTAAQVSDLNWAHLHPSELRSLSPLLGRPKKEIFHK